VLGYRYEPAVQRQCRDRFGHVYQIQAVFLLHHPIGNCQIDAEIADIGNRMFTLASFNRY
jgi:hypothetical protein